MEHNLRFAMRKTKDVAKGYTDIEGKVREATSNDPWGAPSLLLEEICAATHNSAQLKKIIEMALKRMNDSGKNWRHVMKTLTLLDHIIKNGSEEAIGEIKYHIQAIRTLKEFQYIDENGKDQGINVRHKSKELSNLLEDPQRIKEEREKAKNLRQRLSSNANFSGGYGNSDFTSADRPQSYYGGESGSYSAAAQNPSEDSDLQKAIRESQLTYEAEKRAREISQEAYRAPAPQQSLEPPLPNRQRAQTMPASQPTSSFTSDPFASPDPFGIPPSSQRSQPADPFKGSDPFGTSAPADPFGGDSFGSLGSQKSDPLISGFGSSFDGGNEARKLPHQKANSNDPNSMLASIARNSAAIDPFAEIASNRSTSSNSFGQPAPAFGQPMSGFGQTAPGFGQPAPGFGQPMSGFGQPVPGYGQPMAGSMGYGRPMNQSSGNLFGAAPSNTPQDPFGDIGGHFGGEVLQPDNKKGTSDPSQFQGIVNLDNLTDKGSSSNPFSTQKSQQFDWGNKTDSRPLNQIRKN